MARTSTASILFCDLVGSTERFVALGDDVADGFIRRFLDCCRHVVEDHGGTVIKTLGDGLMAVFERRTLDAVEAALELHEATAALDPDDPPRLRVGISVGEVNLDEGDWYGQPVIEANRLCSAAAPGTTLATTVVRTIIGTRGKLNFVDAGSRTLRGIPGRVATVRIEAPPPPLPEVAEPVAAAGGASAATRRRRWWIAALAVLVAAGATGGAIWAGGGGASTNKATEPAPLYHPRFERRACAAGTDDQSRTCGVLKVPQDRAKPEGRWIEVPLDVWAPVAGAPASAKQHAALEIGSVVNEDQSPTRLLERQVRLGVRGREGTPTLNCPEVTVAGKAHLLDPLYSDVNVSAHVTALRACRDRWTSKGVDVTHYSNEDIALDVSDAMVALALPPIDLIAGTDQTPAALSLMRDEPASLRTATLINPPGPNMSSGQLVMSFRQAFAAYGSLCRADPRCGDVLPDPAGTWKKIYDQLQASPALETGTLPDGTALRMVVDGDRGATALEVAVGSTPLLPYLHLTLTGDAAAAAAGNAYEKSDTSDAVPIGADLSDICNRIAPNDAPIDRDQIERFPEYRSGRFRLVSQSCAAWNVPAAPVRFRSAVASAVPTTIVVGNLSTATNPAAIDGIVRGLDHVVLFQFPTLGFSPMFDGPSCLLTMWRSWLAHPLADVSTSKVSACVASAPAIPFLDHL